MRVSAAQYSSRSMGVGSSGPEYQIVFGPSFVTVPSSPAAALALASALASPRKALALLDWISVRASNQAYIERTTAIGTMKNSAVQFPAVRVLRGYHQEWRSDENDEY